MAVFNLVIILLSTLNSETIDSNNYRIAKYMLENLNDLENCSITELAKNCYVSMSSISRFCRDIGLEDFNALKNQVAKYQTTKEQSQKKFNFHRKETQDMAIDYIDDVIANLEMLKSSISFNDIKQLVKDIYDYKEVAAFGYLQSQNVAMNLQNDLITNEKLIHTSMKYASQIEYIKQAKKDQLIIVFSQSGSYFDRAFTRKSPFNQNNKPKIYMISSNPKVKKLSYVDHAIIYNCEHDYASHPYPLEVIRGLICAGYARYKEIKDN